MCCSLSAFLGQGRGGGSDGRIGGCDSGEGGEGGGALPCLLLRAVTIDVGFQLEVGRDARLDHAMLKTGSIPKQEVESKGDGCCYGSSGMRYR